VKKQMTGTSEVPVIWYLPSDFLDALAA